jgi:hypothetical protein
MVAGRRQTAWRPVSRLSPSSCGSHSVRLRGGDTKGGEALSLNDVMVQETQRNTGILFSSIVYHGVCPSPPDTPSAILLPRYFAECNL